MIKGGLEPRYDASLRKINSPPYLNPTPTNDSKKSTNRMCIDMNDRLIPLLNGKPWVPPTGEELEKAKKRGDVISIHNSVIGNENLSPGEKIVYSELKRKYQMVDTDYVKTTQAELAEKLGMNKSNVGRALKELKKEGYLEITKDEMVDWKYFLYPPAEEESGGKT